MKPKRDYDPDELGVTILSKEDAELIILDDPVIENETAYRSQLKTDKAHAAYGLADKVDTDD